MSNSIIKRRYRNYNADQLLFKIGAFGTCLWCELYIMSCRVIASLTRQLDVDKKSIASFHSKTLIKEMFLVNAKACTHANARAHTHNNKPSSDPHFFRKEGTAINHHPLLECYRNFHFSLPTIIWQNENENIRSIIIEKPSFTSPQKW